MVQVSHLKLIDGGVPAWIGEVAARESAQAAQTLRDVLAFVTPRYEGKTLDTGEDALGHVMGVVPLVAGLNCGRRWKSTARQRGGCATNSAPISRDWPKACCA
jgi:hypothetical protein